MHICMYGNYPLMLSQPPAIFNSRDFLSCLWSSVSYPLMDLPSMTSPFLPWTLIHFPHSQYPLERFQFVFGFCLGVAIVFGGLGWFFLGGGGWWCGGGCFGFVLLLLFLGVFGGEVVFFLFVWVFGGFFGVLQVLLSVTWITTTFCLFWTWFPPGTRGWFNDCTYLLVIQLFCPWLHTKLLSEYHLVLIFVSVHSV